jgi:hypothetical protein
VGRLFVELADYVRWGSKAVAGWLSRVDGQLFVEVMDYQRDHGIGGGVAEIGVHHGRSFIALCLGLQDGDKAYAIDIFEDQAKNLDRSGLGDRAQFEANLARFGIGKDRVIIDARGSDEVAPDDIVSKVGPVRFFSVDGGHWREIVSSDLRLAASTLSEQGVIALDDFMRPEWPDVSLGLFDWFENSDKSVVPFAIGFNKLYLCRRERVGMYQGAVDTDYLRSFQSKSYNFLGVEVPVFQTYQLPEWGRQDRLLAYLRLYHSDVYAWIIKRKARLQHRAH